MNILAAPPFDTLFAHLVCSFKRHVRKIVIANCKLHLASGLFAATLVGTVAFFEVVDDKTHVRPPQLAGTHVFKSEH